MAKQFLNYIPKADGIACILLYGDVGQWGDVDSQRVVTELLHLEQEYTTIEVRINSTGGDVFSGIAIFNALRQSKADIRIYIDGLAASIAGVIALCGKPLYMSQYARLMLHKVSAGAYGSAKELRETARLIDDLEESLSEMIAGRMGAKREEVHSRYFADGADHWFTAHEALALGMIDGINDLEEAPELSPQSTTEEIYQAFNNRLSREVQNSSNSMALLDDIKSIPSFQNATEQDIVARLREQTTKLEASEQAIQALRAKLDELETKELENILNLALSEGRITEAQKPTYLNLLRSDRANTETLLNSLPKTRQGFRSAKSFTEQGGGAGTSVFYGKSWAELDRAGLLSQYKEQDPEGFASAYKAEFGVDYRF